MKHLLMFDIDGTLVDSNAFDSELFSLAIREELGVQVDETWESYRHVTDSGILEEVIATGLPQDERARVRKRVRQRFVMLVEEHVAHNPGAVRPIPGAPALLHRLRSLPRVICAVATGGWRETAELKLRVAGIEFEGLPFATSSDAEARADIMRLAEQRAAASGTISRRTYFGDAPWDLRASTELGYEFVAVGDRVAHSLRFPDLSDQDGILAALGA